MPSISLRHEIPILSPQHRGRRAGREPGLGGKLHAQRLRPYLQQVTKYSQPVGSRASLAKDMFCKELTISTCRLPLGFFFFSSKKLRKRWTVTALGWESILTAEDKSACGHLPGGPQTLTHVGMYLPKPHLAWMSAA